MDPALVSRTAAGGGPASDAAAFPRRSLLRQQGTWRILILWALGFGLATGALEAVLALLLPNLPGEPWQASFRIPHTLLWTLVVALALAVAERWPIHSPTRQLTRVLGQVLVGFLLGPVWAIVTYSLSAVFMPWEYEAGLWSMVAADAKGTLFGYGTAAVLAHLVLRAREQREAAVAAAEANARIAEARVQIVTLGIQSEGALAALDRIIALASHDPKGANDALVLLADVLGQFVEFTRTGSATLGEELALASTQAHLLRMHQAHGPTVSISWDASPHLLAREIPHLALWPVLERAIARGSVAAGSDVLVHVAATLGADRELIVTVVERGGICPAERTDADYRDPAAQSRISHGAVRVSRREHPDGAQTTIVFASQAGSEIALEATRPAATALTASSPATESD